MASEPPQDKPYDIDDFDAAVDNALASLRDAVNRTGLPASYFRDRALEHKEAILEELGSQREDVEWLRGAVTRTQTRRWIAAVSVGGLMVSLASLGQAVNPSLSLSEPLGLFIAGVFLLILAATLARSTLGDQGLPSRLYARRSLLRSTENGFRGSLDTALLTWLTELANEKLGEVYKPELPDLDPTGLAEIDDPDHEIRTQDGESVEQAITHMPGGSIGISGPRGTGKTTLLRRLTIEAKRQRPQEIKTAIVVDAPVEYEARDFVLHLFASLCEAVLSKERVEEMRSWNRGFDLPGVGLVGKVLARVPALLGPGLMGAGLLVYLALLRAERRPYPTESIELLAAAAISAGVLITALNLGARILARIPITTLDRHGRWWRLRFGEAGLALTAERHLRQIWFQRTFSNSWSGALKSSIGVEVGADRSTQIAENQLNFPEVVELYRRFVARVVKAGQVRIGVDELDKMEDDQARRFLNEIKVIFRVSGCFYLVSVSEDAMAYFERRGLPFRDVFDSSFDDVMRMHHLRFVDSREMLRRRVVGMPVQFIYLCHILGAGLARDVIRMARKVSERSPGEDIGATAAALCSEQLRSKCIAARVAVRRLKDPAHSTLLGRFLREIEHSATDDEVLFEHCSEFEQKVIAAIEVPAADDADGRKEHREALSIAFETATFTYFVVTVRGLMGRLDSEEAARTAIHDGTIDQLAIARQAFAVHPSEAWEEISTVRASPMQVADLALPEIPGVESTPRPATWLDRFRQTLRHEPD